MHGLLIIGGPTGSGKSALALRLAQRLNGAIINADSMQQYRELSILTARPTSDDLIRVPHFLYGDLAATSPGSAGTWLSRADEAIRTARSQGRLPIIVGGTGLYIRALLHGIAPVPMVPADIREATIDAFERQGARAFHANFAKRDPAMAKRLRPSDRQRLIRAAEVLEATGRSLLAWQAEMPKRSADAGPFVGVSLDPPRGMLHQRIEQRLHRMVKAGALEELALLRELNLPPSLPLMKAVAVPELGAHLEGELDLDEAIARATARTRQYAKRQLTWFRHQLPELLALPAFGDGLDLDVVLPPAIADRLTDMRLPPTVRPDP